MSKTLTDQTLALAGMFQAVSLVDQVARRGMLDQGQFETCIRSLFTFAPDTTEDVYGSSSELRPGLNLIRGQFTSGGKQRNLELSRYVIALLHLERKLARDKGMLQRIRTGLERAERQAAHFTITHENVIASLADTYVNTISTLSPRIMVTGEHGHLQHPANSARVRALLLAAMRSAVLWRQSGGSRLSLLFRRKALLDEASRLLA
jgi:high frequency lysogenization protein